MLFIHGSVYLCAYRENDFRGEKRTLMTGTETHHSLLLFVIYICIVDCI